MVSYLNWARSQATLLRNTYTDAVIEECGLAVMRGKLLESHSDVATDQLSVQMCTAGDYVLTADLGDGVFRARRGAGDAIIGPPGVDLKLSGRSEAGIEITIVAIDRTRVETLVEEATGTRTASFGALHKGVVRDPNLTAIVRLAFSELLRKTAFTRLQGDGMVQILVATLLRMQGEGERFTRGGLAPWQIDRVMEFMGAHYNRDVGIAELANVVGLSSSHFSRAFRTSIGVSPHRRQMELRMDRAKQLLAEDSLSLAEVAVEVGYNSQQAFSRIFLDVTGTSPGRFRRERRS